MKMFKFILNSREKYKFVLMYVLIILVIEINLKFLFTYLLVRSIFFVDFEFILN